ncbi:MAG: BatA domain-containing protein [candidate division KSB1 bacterium]|nr:BatA domain-containing protein [candidate division KSB1 bacterium]
MTFLNTAVLIGLIAGAIPIIIHLITRQKARIVQFSTLRFLRELQNQQIRRLRLRQIMLLILRTLIVLLLVLAFARPTLKGHLGAGVQSAARTTAVLILDNSLSMSLESGGHQAFDIARQRALELESLFKTGDEIYGIYATTAAPPMFENPRYDFQTIMKIIQKARPGQGSTDLVAALLQARDILEKSANLNKEIYVISDFQQTGFRQLEKLPAPIFKDTRIKIYLVPIQLAHASNLLITRVKPANQIIEKGKVVELDATIKNAGTKAERNKLVQLFLDDKRMGQATIHVEPGASQTTKFRIVPQRAGLIAGSALLEDDDLFGDNRCFFTLSVPEQISVLVIGQNERDTRFLQLALNPEQLASSAIKVDMLTPNRIESGIVQKYQVVILSNLPRVDGILFSSVIDHVQAGGGLIVFLGEAVDLRYYNEHFNQKMRLPLFTETIGEMGSRASSLTLGTIDFSHPIFAGVFEDQKKAIESPQFYFLTRMKLAAAHEKIMAFSNDDPFLMESDFGRGKVLLFASAIDPNWSDLYLKGLFVPLMNRCVMYLAGHANRSEGPFVINQELSTEVIGFDNLAALEIVKPDGQTVKVIPRIGEGKYRVNFKDTDQAGIYSLQAGDRLITQWAVNPDPAESEFTPIDRTELERIVGNDNLIAVDPEQSLANAVITSRYGRELWKHFIAAALVLLLIEMILARESKPSHQEVTLEKVERAI